MVTMSNQNAKMLLASIDVNLGEGYTLSSEGHAPECIDYAFDITKRNMKELYDGAPEWGWDGT